ncbi:MAG: UDP-N-acetylmuramate dehydrogenase, partial [Chitinophagaceae bacterium]|nr:UDP-N-acetylmuramate dehydrogenase [Chitinophagaceae bacterium]
MNTTKNKSLRSYNTFHIEQSVETFIEINHENELLKLIKDKNTFSKPIYILGGGSNILLTKNLEGILLHNRLKGIEIINEEDEHVFVKFHSGEIWHECVLWSIKHHLAGIENLSLIPGTIGAAPIQNIGAYGVELKDVFHQLEAIHLQSGNRKIFNRIECQFAYRNSLFKTTEYKNYFITHVVLKLNKTPKYKIDYGDIRKTIDEDFQGEINIQNIAQAVINIRKSKLPDPAEIGNAGSFFKNP